MRPKSLFRGQLHLAGSSGKSGTGGKGSSLSPCGESRDEFCIGGQCNCFPKKVNGTTSTAKTSKDGKF